MEAVSARLDSARRTPMDTPDSTATMYRNPPPAEGSPTEPPTVETRLLTQRYWEIVNSRRINWTEHHRLIRLLGAGGHGVVYLSEGRCSDDFTLPVALKIFSPERYRNEEEYSAAMRQAARVASRVARIQHDNLLDVHRWNDRGWVRVMEMEWIDGFDLRRLLTHATMEKLRGSASPESLRSIHDVVVTDGPVQPRLKPGVATAIVRDCLAALDALHRAGVIHADIKPANIMLKRTGNAKVIDIASAFLVDALPERYTCTPVYAAPEVLESGCWSAQADLASLGYVLVELLSGRPPFFGASTYAELVQAKRALPQRLPDLLPKDVVRNDLLMHFCSRLVAPDPAARFATAAQADSDKAGAAGFHRQLIKVDLASEYDKDIRAWLENLGE